MDITLYKETGPGMAPEYEVTLGPFASIEVRIHGIYASESAQLKPGIVLAKAAMRGGYIGSDGAGEGKGMHFDSLFIGE